MLLTWRDLKALFRVALIAGVAAASFQACNSIVSLNSDGGKEHKVGVEARKDGSWVEHRPGRLPFQFLGGVEGGRESWADSGRVTEPFFLPRGAVKVSGFAYGDCTESFDTNLTISAFGASGASKGESYPHFIAKPLPAGREEVPIKGILSVDTPGMYVLEVNSESPLWGLRIASVSDRDGWSGLVPSLSKPAERHCWTSADQQREDEAIQAQQEEENYREELRDAQAYAGTDPGWLSGYDHRLPGPGWWMTTWPASRPNWPSRPLRSGAARCASLGPWPRISCNG